MTKRECLDELIYNLKMHDSADFEADERSYTVSKNGREYMVETSTKYYECKNLTEVRKTISKLGKNILVL